MMLARERPYRSPSIRTSDQDRSCHFSPPQLSPRKMGSHSTNSRTLMVSKDVPQSLLLPLSFEGETRGSFPRSRFTLQPRNGVSTQQTPAGQTRAKQTQTTTPVMVTPRCQNINRAKRQRQCESDSDDEEVCRINLPKKLLLSLD